MSEEEKKIFFIDITKIDQRKTFSKMVMGIQKYFIGQDMITEDDGYRQIVRKNQLPYGHHIRVASDNYPGF